MTDDELDQCIAQIVWWAATTAPPTEPAEAAEAAELTRFRRKVWQEYLRRRAELADDDSV